METLELPVVEELEESAPWPNCPPVKFEEQELDLAVFKIWRRASRLDIAAGEDATGVEETK